MAPKKRDTRIAQPPSSPPPGPLPDDEGDAPDLLSSFLTTFDQPRRAQAQSDAGGSSSGASEERYYEDEPEDEDLEGLDSGEEEGERDPDDDGPGRAGTPSKRAKTGLLATPTKRKTPGKTPTPTKKRTPRKPATATRIYTDLGMGEGKGIIRTSKADSYFLSMSTSAKTSGASYSSLAPLLSSAAYDRHTSQARSKGKAKESLLRLEDAARARYPQYELECSQGFNLLFWGYGSKRGFMNGFASWLRGRAGDVVVINGHYPQVGIRDILSGIEDGLGVPQSIPTPASAATPLEKQIYRIYSYYQSPNATTATPPNPAQSQSKASRGRTKGVNGGDAQASASRSSMISERDLYLVIHNIDSAGLMSSKSLSILSLLALCPRIHLVASFDQPHTPLLFSQAQTNEPKHSLPIGSKAWEAGTSKIPPSRGFNWLYHNRTTFADYTHEFKHQRLALSGAGGGVGGVGGSAGGTSEESIAQILASVPPNALRLVKLLLTQQLAAMSGPGPGSGPGTGSGGAGGVAPVWAIDNDILRHLAKEKFIAREEDRYNALLGEFRDHGLVLESSEKEGEREVERGKWVWVALGRAGIERVIKSMEGVEM